MRLSTRIGDRTLVVQAADALAPQAEWLLGVLASALDGAGPRDGTTVEIGWSLLTLKERGGELLVCEPDYAGDPFRDLSEDVSRTLAVLARQSDVLKRVGAQMTPARFDERVVVAEGALGARRIYLHRRERTTPDDTGWYVGHVERQDGEPILRSLRVYEVLRERPELGRVLALPADYVVVFDGDEIAGIQNEREQEVWQPAT